MLRAVAILLVVCGHGYLLSGEAVPRARTPSSMAIAFGASGVWLFFILSGYLIAGPFLRGLIDGQRMNLRTVALRRTVRIYPAYWLAFLAVLGLTAASAGGWQLFVHVALLHNLFPGEQHAVYPASWTLTLEVLFYAFVPLAALMAAPRQWDRTRLAVALMALAGGSMIWTTAAAASLDLSRELATWATGLFPARLIMFVPGMYVFLERLAPRDDRSLVWRPYRRAMAHPQATLTIVAVTLALGAFTGTSGQRFVYTSSAWLYAIGYGLLLGLVVCHRTPRTFRRLAPLGVVSYGLYLWHTMLIGWLLEGNHLDYVPVRGGGVVAWVIHIGFLFAISIGPAIGSWFLVERPLMRYTARRASGRLAATTGTRDADTRPTPDPA